MHAELHVYMMAGPGSSLGCASAWLADSRGFDPRIRQHAFIEIVFLKLIQIGNCQLLAFVCLRVVGSTRAADCILWIQYLSQFKSYSDLKMLKQFTPNISLIQNPDCHSVLCAIQCTTPVVFSGLILAFETCLNLYCDIGPYKRQYRSSFWSIYQCVINWMVFTNFSFTDLWKLYVTLQNKKIRFICIVILWCQGGEDVYTILTLRLTAWYVFRLNIYILTDKRNATDFLCQRF